jgi:hypothetical protein
MAAGLWLDFIQNLKSAKSEKSIDKTNGLKVIVV